MKALVVTFVLLAVVLFLTPAPASPRVDIEHGDPLLQDSCHLCAWYNVQCLDCLLDLWWDEGACFPYSPICN